MDHDELIIGGELGDFMRRHDLTSTALGPSETWPDLFKNSLQLCLNAAYPLAIYWGPELRLFYNDAWRPIAGDKHPWAIGRPGCEVWPEVWDVVGPQFQAVMDSKKGVVTKDRLLFLQRLGFTEECYFDYSFTPILDANGAVSGILNIGMETTARILSERREKLVRHLMANVPNTLSVQEAWASALGALAAGSRDVPFASCYLVDRDGRCLTRVATMGVKEDSSACPTAVDLEAEGGLAPWPFAEVLASGEEKLVEAGVSQLDGLSSGPWSDKPRQAMLVPVKAEETNEVAAILVLGVSPRLSFDEAYREFLGNAASALAMVVGKAHAYQQEKRMRRDAEDARERLALTYEGAEAVGWDMELKTGRVTRSGNVKAVYGRTAPDSVFWNLIHPDDQDTLRESMANAVANKGAFQSEFRILLPDGGVRWLSSKGKVILGADGTVERLAGVNLDITAKRSTQDALRRHAEQLQKLAAASLALAKAKSTAELLEIASEEAARIIGAHAELELHPDNRMPHGSSFVSPRACLVAPLLGRDGRNLGFIQLSDKREGEFSAEDEAVLVQITQQVATAWENIELIEKIQVVNERLREADRRKDEFLAVVSHELRSPLNVIAGHAQLLRMGVVGSRDFKDSLNAIERSAATQAQLISDLLDISRIVTGKFMLDVSRFDLVPVLDAAIDSVRFAADSKGVVITKHFDASVGAVVGDATRIQQLVWNLLANAVKFTPSGGFVLFSATRRGEQVDLAIADTGQGISADFLPYVFDRFHQEDASKTRKYGGLGLGLAIARYIAELHGGLISAESEGKGKGATFAVKLPTRQLTVVPTPASHDLPPAELVHQGEHQRDQFKGLRILVIDDQEDARDMVAKIYEFLGAEVTVVASAPEGLDALSQEKFALLVCDIGMPDMNGLQFLRHWRQYERLDGREPIPAIALTAYANQEDGKAVIKAGFQYHLVKPVNIATLARLTTDLCARPPECEYGPLLAEARTCLSEKGVSPWPF